MYIVLYNDEMYWNIKKNIGLLELPIKTELY